MSSDKHLRCSFCGKSKDSVKKFISGPSVYICNVCISLCNEILAEEEEREQAEAADSPVAPGGRKLVYVEREVGPVEASDAEMENARAQRRALVARYRNAAGRDLAESARTEIGGTPRH